MLQFTIVCKNFRYHRCNLPKTKRLLMDGGNPPYSSRVRGIHTSCYYKNYTYMLVHLTMLNNFVIAEPKYMASKLTSDTWKGSREGCGESSNIVSREEILMQTFWSLTAMKSRKTPSNASITVKERRDSVARRK